MTVWARPRGLEQPLRHTARFALLFIALGVACVPWTAGAAEPPARSAPAPTRERYDIPAGPLGRVLASFATRAGIALSFDPALTNGRMSPGLSGRYSTQEGFARLLAGTGLQLVTNEDGSYTLRKAPAGTAGAINLSPVRVAADLNATNANSDAATVTEGSGSYTSKALTIGSKVPQPMQETPQSVSVITQQRIEDQNLTDVASALAQSTGITTVQGGSNVSNSVSFQSRGFTINALQIDGGAPLNLNSDGIGGGNPLFGVDSPDLALYDHVEILRGADGLFTGAGNPGGVINLVHKLPLDYTQVTVEGDAGSWNNYREVVDGTGPLGFDGALSGRVVAVNQDQDYFYNVAFSHKYVLYGVVKYDVSPSTVLTVGGDFGHRVTAPGQQYGLPRYITGADLDLPRDTCLCASWSRWVFDDSEVFVNLKRGFGPNWTLKLNFNHLQQSSWDKYAVASGSGVNPVTLGGFNLGGHFDSYDTIQTAVDATLNGSFQLLGRRQDVVMGANYQRVIGDEAFYDLYPSGGPSVDVMDFSPSAWPQPAVPRYPYDDYPTTDNEQYGVYATLRLHLLDGLSLIGGARLSGYQTSYNLLFGNLAGTIPPTPRLGSNYKDDTVVTPYGGLVYDLTPHYSLYASYTSIYVSQADDIDTSGKPLTAETGINVETGAKATWFNGALNGSLAAYRVNQKNLGEYVSSGAAPAGSYCCYAPVGNLESEGFEGELTGELLPGWQMYAGYTYNLNRYLKGFSSRDGETESTITPKHMFRLWTTGQLPGPVHGLSLGGGMNLQSATYVSGTACPTYNPTGFCSTTTTPYSFVQGFYAVFSARVGYRISDHWSAGLNLNNLTDRRYYQTVGNTADENFYGDPRNFMLSVHAKW